MLNIFHLPLAIIIEDKINRCNPIMKDNVHHYERKQSKYQWFVQKYNLMQATCSLLWLWNAYKGGEKCILDEIWMKNKQKPNLFKISSIVCWFFTLRLQPTNQHQQKLQKKAEVVFPWIKNEMFYFIHLVYCKWCH